MIVESKLKGIIERSVGRQGVHVFLFVSSDGFMRIDDGVFESETGA